MFRHIFLLLFFPLLLRADIDTEYSEIFIQSLNSKNIDESHKILDDWELCNPDIFSTVKGLRAVFSSTRRGYSSEYFNDVRCFICS